MARIAMVVSNRHDPDVRVQKEAATLTRAGHNVTIYAFDREHNASRLPETMDGVRIERIQVREAPIGNLPLTMMGLVEFRAEVRRRLLANPVQVVHCHDQDTCAVGLWWKQEGAEKSGPGSRGYFVFDAHDLYWTWLLMPDPKSLWRKCGAQVLKAQAFGYARAADLVITVTEGSLRHPGLAEVFRGWGIEPEVIWNAPHVPESVPGLPGRFTVGYIGSVREPAMFNWLISAIAAIPAKERPALFVAGGGAAESVVTENLQTASEKLDFPLIVTGRFSLDELPSLMAQTSIQYCLYPQDRGNIARAMPVKLLESIAYGRPVIGNADTLMGEWIERNKWGYQVPQADPEALAKAIRAAQVGLSRGDFSVLREAPLWSDEGQKLVSVYERLLK